MNMKTKNVRVFYLLFTVLYLVVVTMLITSCGGDEKEVDPIEVAKSQLMANPWKLNSVTVDGVDKTSLFTGLKVVFSNSSYTATPSNVIWRSSGNWELESATVAKLTPTQQEPIIATIISLSETKVQLSLQWDETTIGSGGRGESIEGSYIFEFIK
jgi:hypothetical protein